MIPRVKAAGVAAGWTRRALPIVLVCVGAALGAIGASGDGRAPALLTLGIIVVLVVVMVAMSRRDATSVLTLLIAVLFLIPENFVLVGPLKSVGNPAILVGLMAGVVWLTARAMGAVHAETWHPYRWTMMVFVATGLTAFAAALTRTLTQDEADSASRTVFPILAMVGVAMLATDGLATMEQIQRVLRRLVLFVAIESAIGLLQFFVKFDYVSIARLPGLTVNTEVSDWARSGFDRVQAASAHPIEYSVALSVVVPIALHFALNASDRVVRRRYWIMTGLIAVTVPLTVSRAGLLGLVVGVAVYGVVLRGRARANIAVLSFLALVAFPVVAPGILGTVRSFFFAGTQDDSITGRLDDYANLPGLLDGHVWFGRGFGTFIPSDYFFLDNQYLMSLLTGGVVGMLSLVSLYVVGAGTARGARKRFSRSEDKDLAQAVAAAILALAVTAATFDQFSFLQAAFLVFLLGGIASALWSLARAEERAREHTLEEPEVSVLAPVTAMNDGFLSPLAVIANSGLSDVREHRPSVLG